VCPVCQPRPTNTGIEGPGAAVGQADAILLLIRGQPAEPLPGLTQPPREGKPGLDIDAVSGQALAGEVRPLVGDILELEDDVPEMTDLNSHVRSVGASAGVSEAEEGTEEVHILHSGGDVKADTKEARVDGP